MVKVSAYIIAYNEAEKIRAALDSVLWADEIVVADSFSTDGTSEIAESLGARVIQIPFKGFGDLRIQSIAACTHDWIFSLDADERCTPEVRDEILEIIQSDDPQDVYYVPRKNFFMGRWIKHSGFYPDFRQPQLFRKGTLVFKPDPVHERFDLRTAKPPGFLKTPIWQLPYKNFEEILHKANRYSSLGAVKLAKHGKTSGMTTAFFHALWSFVQLFILKKGVLDGWAGFVIAFGNFEGTFYKYAKLYEAQSKWRPPDSLSVKEKASS
ncbi:MAG: glycosyltransferase family 2 protein [Deltaproteobacteria bacterium]|nr:glycosyltransferase family 2 protein [Deltaproteobacteria bacterium]MBW2193480.1 glycosyltransferase family 2 protein [Deltaproteobacteria bacterium]